MITLPAKAYLQAKLKYNFVHNLFLYFKVFRRKLASIWRQQLPPSMLFFGQSWRSSSALSWWQRATNIRTPLPHIPVTAFSQTDLFSVWIYAWIQIATETSVTNCNHKHALMLTCHMFTWGRIVLFSPKRAHVDLNWNISRKKYLKIDWSVKMPLHCLIMRVASS